MGSDCLGRIIVNDISKFLRDIGINRLRSLVVGDPFRHAVPRHFLP